MVQPFLSVEPPGRACGAIPKRAFWPRPVSRRLFYRKGEAVRGLSYEGDNCEGGAATPEIARRRKDGAMSSFLESMLARAKADKRTIVLPEGDDERTLAAAERILADDVADLVILGDADAIAASPYALDGARVIDPRASDLREGFAQDPLRAEAGQGHDRGRGACPHRRRAVLRRDDGEGRPSRRHGGRRVPRDRRRAAPEPADPAHRAGREAGELVFRDGRSRLRHGRGTARSCSATAGWRCSPTPRGWRTSP